MLAPRSGRDVETDCSGGCLKSKRPSGARLLVAARRGARRCRGRARPTRRPDALRVGQRHQRARLPLLEPAVRVEVAEREHVPARVTGCGARAEHAPRAGGCDGTVRLLREGELLRAAIARGGRCLAGHRADSRVCSGAHHPHSTALARLSGTI